MLQGSLNIMSKCLLNLYELLVCFYFESFSLPSYKTFYQLEAILKMDGTLFLKYFLFGGILLILIVIVLFLILLGILTWKSSF